MGDSPPFPVRFYIPTEDSNPEIRIILDFKEVNPLLFSENSPRGQMDLHDSDRITPRHRKWVGSALDNDHTGYQLGIHIVFKTAGRNSLCNAVSLTEIHSIAGKQLAD